VGTGIIIMEKIVIPCSGFIILSPQNDKTILVKTHMGNFSFPKGKRKKSETYMETALRELKEETGLTEDDIIIKKDQYFDEKSYKGNPSVRYFIANAKKSDDVMTFSLDELEDSKWYDIEKVFLLKKIKNSRKEILKQVLQHNLSIS
jgi:8-oxo-dGTP pyrophosphatase MutT (NUDIX family)